MGSTAATPAVSSMCTKCGTTMKSGKASCCAPGGAWFKKCGDPGDSNFDHTWFEGIQACKSKFTADPLGSTTITTSTATITTTLATITTTSKPEGPPSTTATTIVSSKCIKCGIIKNSKTGIRSCCAR